MSTPRRIAALGLLWTAVSGISSFTTSAVADSGAGLTTKSLCAAPALNQISCDAQVLVSKRTGKPIHPKPRRVVHHKARLHAATVLGQSAPQTMTPAYLQQAYDLTYLSATHGQGDTIAIIGVYNDPNAASDLGEFRSTFGLPACTTANGCLQVLNEQGQASPLPGTDWSWAQEESMDLDAVSSLCPNCKIDLLEANSPTAPDLQTTITSAIAQGANQVSISGAGEFSSSPFTDFSAPNVSILAAAGDDGVIPPGFANYPAALPWVTAVGGTSLQADSVTAATPRGVHEGAWSDSGSGCDTQEQPLAYQPSVGCAGRVYSDVSADADPSTGLSFYDSQAGGWLDGGGTSLATPLVAAFEAVTGVDGSTSQWAYQDAANLNEPSTGSTGPCTGQPTVLCDATGGYSGPTGAGSISGQIVTGAPGIGDPALGSVGSKTYLQRVTATSAYLQGGVYPNGQATEYYWQYGPSRAYGYQTQEQSAGSGSQPVSLTSELTGLTPNTTYHFRLVAVNATGTTYGYDFTLKTAPKATTARARVRRAKRA